MVNLTGKEMQQVKLSKSYLIIFKKKTHTYNYCQSWKVTYIKKKCQGKATRTSEPYFGREAFK